MLSIFWSGILPEKPTGTLPTLFTVFTRFHQCT